MAATRVALSPSTSLGTTLFSSSTPVCSFLHTSLFSQQRKGRSRTVQTLVSPLAKHRDKSNHPPSGQLRGLHIRHRKQLWTNSTRGGHKVVFIYRYTNRAGHLWSQCSVCGSFSMYYCSAMCNTRCNRMIDICRYDDRWGHPCKTKSRIISICSEPMTASEQIFLTFARKINSLRH